MSNSAKGSIENPNMRSSAKRGLNRSILHQSWGKFFELLDYKLKRNGGELIRVDPKFTSQNALVVDILKKRIERLNHALFARVAEIQLMQIIMQV